MSRVTRTRLAVATGTAVAVVAAMSAIPTLTPATAAPTGTGAATQHVIVVLKDQLPSEPPTRAHLGARKSEASSAQNDVLTRLKGAKPTHVTKYTVGNAFAATVTSAQAAQLSADPAVASVVPDLKVQIAPPTASQAAAAKPAASSAATSGPSEVDPSACTGTKNKPQLEPEALQSMNVRSDDPNAKTAAALGIDGTGVKVAFIADGINPQNAGFLRTNGTSSITDYKDFYGDGPNAVTSGAEAFGDASAISAQGNVTYDVKDYANPNVVTFPKNGHCYIRIVGVAPGADVIALKAGSELLPNSAILQAIDYAVTTAHVDVINESFGANIEPDSGARNTVQLFDDNAVAAGVTVTESTGDAGISSTIGSSATDPLVLSAAASTDSRIYEQTGYALATAFSNGTWQDNNTSALSSAGITQNGRTPDIEAPGEADWAVCDDSGNFTGCTSFGNPQHPFVNIQAFGGTSQSSPLTAGVAALVIQAYRKTHGGTSPTPAVVKQIITSSATDVDEPGDEQGSGLINARAAVEDALSWTGATGVPAGITDPAVALSTNQLTLTGAPGTTQTGHVTVTNVGSAPVSVATSARKYIAVGNTSSSVDLDTSLPTTPYPTNGAAWVYRKTTFTVPGGSDELRAAIRWQSGATYNGAGPVVRMTLLDPNGAFASNTRPQGGAVAANYGLSTVKAPQAGTWTAILYTPLSGGYTGPVALDTTSYRAIGVGTTTPSTTTLAPGAKKSVAVTMPVPASGGDTVDTVSIASSGGHRVAVPVVVRSLVPTDGSGTFAGSITGGNGRAYSPAQTFSYAFDVPSGERDLNVAVKLKDDSTDLLEGVLVDPNGEVQSVNSNQRVNAAGKTKQSLAMMNVAAAPMAGRWRYVIVVIDPVSGKEAVEPFTGTVGFDKFDVTAPKLPAKIKHGSSVTLKYTVHNNGSAPLVLQTDARTGAATQVQLSPIGAGSRLTLPQNVDDLSQLPGFLVPPLTNSLSVTAASSTPAQVELSSPTGGIDVFGDLNSAKAGDTISTAKVSEKTSFVGLGLWSPYVQQIGPFGDGGAPAGTSYLSASAITVPFDQSVTSSTGDPFLATIDPTADAGTPVVIAAGKSAVVTVTFKPTAAVGTVVSGTLNFVTPPLSIASSFNTTGELAGSTGYSYKVS